MPDDRTDLLPPERQKALGHDYKVRLAVVILIFITILTLVSMLLSVPTYVLLSASARAKVAQLVAIDATATSTSGATLSARLLALDHASADLAALAHAPSASALVRALLDVPRPLVTLSGIAYTPANGASAGILAITGIAASRDALRSYQIALQGAPFALSADLPVSAFAKDSNILFTVKITLKP